MILAPAGARNERDHWGVVWGRGGVISVHPPPCKVPFITLFLVPFLAGSGERNRAPRGTKTEKKEEWVVLGAWGGVREGASIMKVFS